MKKRFAFMGLTQAFISGVLVASNTSAQVVGQDALRIDKPVPHGANFHAAPSVAAAGDYVLMGAPELGYPWGDSGGAYLFENGNSSPRMIFDISWGFSYYFQNFSVGPQGQLSATTKSHCWFSYSRVDGARLGTEVALSKRWLAMAAPDLGKGNTTTSPSNCAGVTGRVPTVFLAPASPNPLDTGPYTGPFHIINSPLREDIRDMAVTDTDLVLVAGKGAHVYGFNESSNQWDYNTTLLPNITLGDDSYEGLAIKGNRIILGSPDENKVYVFDKFNENWIEVAQGDMGDANPEWGRALDFEGDRIVVAGNRYLDIVGINTSLSYLYLIDWTTDDTPTHVGVSHNHVVAYTPPPNDPMFGYEPNRTVYPMNSQGHLLQAYNFGLEENNTSWLASSLAVSGNTVVTGFTNCEKGGSLIGCLIFDRFTAPFGDAVISDNAEGDRIWLNGGALDWRRGKQGSNGGASGSEHYYYVEKYPATWATPEGAEDAAILKTQPINLDNYSQLTFSLFMDIDTDGTLHVDIEQDGLPRDTQLSLQKSDFQGTGWQAPINIDLSNYFGAARVQFRYVTGNGEGEVRLDNLLIQ